MNADSRQSRSPWLKFAIVGGLLVVLLAMLLPRGSDDSRSRKRGEMTVIYHEDGGADRAQPVARRTGSLAPMVTPEDIVASKVSQFARSRREICFGMARKHQIEVPAEVERFFDAVEARNWDEIEKLFESIRARHQARPPVPEVDAVWPAILDAFGAAEQAHEWPAQKLLDYGNSIMSSLRPDMVYVGGTDPGRWIPALMNTSEGESRIVITQNGLADGKYLEYVQFLYGDRFAALAPEDAGAAQKAYLQDARKRMEHDQQFPNEPPQLRPGEQVRIDVRHTMTDHKEELWSGFSDGTVIASGQVSVMAVNEQLLQALLQKNPNLSFALEESFPMKSVMTDATPLGPIMELRAEEQNALTPERATKSIEYWREQTQQLLANPEFAESDNARKSYSKLVSSQGGLLADRNYLPEAEDAFRFATELCPYSPEAVFRYVNLLVTQQRSEDAMRVVNNAITSDPKTQQFRDLATQLGKTANH